jgi:hypothetical protein
MQLQLENGQSGIIKKNAIKRKQFTLSPRKAIDIAKTIYAVKVKYP